MVILRCFFECLRRIGCYLHRIECSMRLSSGHNYLLLIVWLHKGSCILELPGRAVVGVGMNSSKLLLLSNERGLLREQGIGRVRLPVKQTAASGERVHAQDTRLLAKIVLRPLIVKASRVWQAWFASFSSKQML